MKRIWLIFGLMMTAVLAIGCEIGPGANAPRIYFGNVNESYLVVEDGDYYLPIVRKDGHTFEGWYLDEYFTEPFLDGQPVNESITLYARFEVRTFELTLIVEDYEYVETFSYAFGERIVFPSPTPQTHYRLKGWAKDPIGEVMFIGSTMPSQSMTLYAIWELHPYRIHLANTNLTPYFITVEDETMNLPTPTKTGHIFEGWYEDEALSLPYEFSFPITEDFTIYAKYELNNYKIFFQSLGGPSYAPLSLTYGDDIPDLPEPSREGYVFGGWHRDNTFKDYFFPTTMPGRDIVLYAFWLPEGYVPETGGPNNSEPLETIIINMVERVKTGVISIINNREDDPSSSGSGVIYKQEGNTYYVVTNEHVVDDLGALSIFYQRNSMLFEIDTSEVTLLGYDTVTDLAVITFTSELNFFVFDIADSYDLKIGQFAFAIGNPLGLEHYGSVTMGIISGLTRFKQLGDTNTAFIQHDAAINPGNSGGALVNSKGELIGINTLKTMRDSVGNPIEGLGFAVPSNTVRRVTQDIEAYGRVFRPFLGITANPYVNSCGQDYGVCVISTSENSAAAAMGLMENDIIVGYKTQDQDDFVTIYNFDQLREVILNSRVGDYVQIQFIRQGVITLSPEVQLGLHPDDE